MADEITTRQKMCEDLLVGAVEGGSGYWSSVSNYEYIEGKAHATIHGLEDKRTFYINWETFDRGLKRIGRLMPTVKLRADLLRQIRVLDACDGEEPVYEAVQWDAETADVVLQVALFGEVVYG